MVHGEEEAKKANDAATAIFSNGNDTSNMPSAEIDAAEIETGVNILDLLVNINLVPSKSEARRLVQQNGLMINGEKVTATDAVIDKSFFNDGEMIIKKGKKTFLKLTLK